eukprot:gene11505-478_t
MTLKEEIVETIPLKKATPPEESADETAQKQQQRFRAFRGFLMGMFIWVMLLAVNWHMFGKIHLIQEFKTVSPGFKESIVQKP